MSLYQSRPDQLGSNGPFVARKVKRKPASPLAPASSWLASARRPVRPGGLVAPRVPLVLWGLPRPPGWLGAPWWAPAAVGLSVGLLRSLGLWPAVSPSFVPFFPARLSLPTGTSWERGRRPRNRAEKGGHTAHDQGKREHGESGSGTATTHQPAGGGPAPQAPGPASPAGGAEHEGQQSGAVSTSPAAPGRHGGDRGRERGRPGDAGSAPRGDRLCNALEDGRSPLWTRGR